MTHPAGHHTMKKQKVKCSGVKAARRGLWCLIEKAHPGLGYYVEWYDAGEKIGGWFLSACVVEKILGLPKPLKRGASKWFEWHYPLMAIERLPIVKDCKGGGE